MIIRSTSPTIRHVRKPFPRPFDRRLTIVALEDLLKPVYEAYEPPSFPCKQCDRGTRVDILAELKRWALSATGPTFYWLVGLAGTGELSALLHTS